MGKLWQRIHDGVERARLEEIDLGTLKIAQPTVIYLSGFLTTNKQPGFIAGGIKRMEELFEAQPALTTQPALLAWSHTNLGNLFNLAAYDARPNRASRAGFDLAAGVLMPLVTKDFMAGPGGKDACGQPLPLEEARRNLRNITFLGYSAGAIVAQETFNAALRMMTATGWQEKDARGVLNEVVLVTAGDFSRLSKQTDRFMTVHMAASNDRLTRFKNWVVGPAGTALRTIFEADAAKKLTIHPLSATSVFVTAPARPSLYEWQYDDDGKRVEKRPFSPLYPKWTLRRSYHELPHYLTTDENNNGFANIALYALINAVNRQQRPDNVLHLLEPPLIAAPTAITSPAEDAYRAKIAQALLRQTIG